MIKEILQEGFILKEKGYYKHAIETFYKVLELDNSSLELLLEIAKCYYLLNDEERALNYIEQILEKEPTHIQALKLLKEIFLSKNALTEAEQTAKNIYCISQDKKDLIEILELLIKLKRFSEVLEYNVENFESDVLYYKAYAKLFLNELDDAETYINKSIDLEESDKKKFLKSKILYKKNKINESKEIINNIQIDIKDSEALNFVGLVEQYNFNFEKALDYFKQAIKLNSKNDEYYYNCASTFFKMGDVQQAKKFYNLAISLGPENQNYHFALANLYYSEKNYKRAMEELNYDFFEARLLKSIILYDSGYLVIAKREFEKLLKEQPENDLIKDYSSRIEEELRI